MLDFETKNNRVFVSLQNKYFFAPHESDLLIFRHGGTCTEYEIKSSRSDFLADFDKTEKHHRLDTMFDLTIIPNEFTFVVPHDIGVTADDVPNYAGLIVVHRHGLREWQVVAKRPPLLHNERGYDWKRIAGLLYL